MRYLFPFLAAAFSFFSVSHPLVAAETGQGPIKVLFLGHESEHHNSGVYCPMIMEAFGRDAIWFDYTTKVDSLNPETLSHYDAVLLYANHGEITFNQTKALTDFIENGGGFVPVHSASACFGNSPAFIKLVGGKFQSHGTGVFKATIVKPDHPAMKGLQEFETWDETYVHSEHNNEGRTILMERVEGNVREPWTWVREQGKGRVFYTASGHDERTWGDAGFQALLRNGILWAVGDKRRADWEAFVAQREVEVRVEDPNVANYENRPKPLTFQKPFQTPKGTTERTQVPADMRLELFAGHPDIGKPIALAWDERGRCWVAETSDYPHDVKPSGEGNDRIRICEDTDGDGKADKFTVFADKLNVPTSLVFARGGLIVAQPPRFLFLKDTDGDDKADVREEIMTGWGIGDTHAQASSLHYGFDNWLYGAVGYSGFNGTVGGVSHEFRMGTYRFKSDGSKIEFLHQFTNNTWGHSQNAVGDQFGGTANGAPIFYGGIPQTIAPAGTRIKSAEKINIVDKAHAITPNYRQVDVFGGYTAAAGSSFIHSPQMPPRLQGMAMVCEPTMKLIALMDVQPEGAGYKAKDGFNLVASTDEWMSPVFAEVGPDGAIWFADWQNFIIQHNPTPSVNRGGYDAKTGVGGAHENPLRDHQRGMIYRVVWEKAPPPATKSLHKAGAEDLVKALSDGNLFWRLTAQRLLVESKTEGVADALKQSVLANDASLGAVHALWTLHGLGLLDAATHQAALLAKDPVLRRNAVRALDPVPTSQALLFGSGVITDPDAITRLATLVKLAEFPESDEIKTIASRIQLDPVVGKDPWLSEAVRILASKYKVSGSTVWKETGPNLLPNPSFEEAKGNQPAGWTFRNYAGQAAFDLGGKTTARTGERSLHVISETGADTSVYADVPVKPDTQYRLSAWVKAKRVRGAMGVLMNVHGTEFKTNAIPGDSKDWEQVTVDFFSGKLKSVSINCLFGGWGQSRGEAWFDDVSLVELAPVVVEGGPEKALAGDAERGKQIFLTHPVAACMNCHMLGGKGSAVGPALDGIATRKDAAYITEALVEPNKILAEGYQALGVSPMPPMNLILKEQELEDIKAFLQTLK